MVQFNGTEGEKKVTERIRVTLMSDGLRTEFIQALKISMWRYIKKKLFALSPLYVESKPKLYLSP